MNVEHVKSLSTKLYHRSSLKSTSISPPPSLSSLLGQSTSQSPILNALIFPDPYGPYPEPTTPPAPSNHFTFLLPSITHPSKLLRASSSLLQPPSIPSTSTRTTASLVMVTTLPATIISLTSTGTSSSSMFVPSITVVAKPAHTNSELESNQDGSLNVGLVIGISSFVTIMMFVAAYFCRKRPDRLVAPTTHTHVPRPSHQSIGITNGVYDDDDEDDDQKQWVCDQCKKTLGSALQPLPPPRSSSMAGTRTNDGGHFESRRRGNAIQDRGSGSMAMYEERVEMLSQHRYQGQRFSRQGRPLHPVTRLWMHLCGFLVASVEDFTKVMRTRVFTRAQGSLGNRHDLANASMVAVRCRVCKSRFYKAMERVQHYSADTPTVPARINSPSMESAPVSSLISSPALPTLPNLPLSPGPFLSSWSVNNDSGGGVSQSSIQYNSNGISDNQARESTLNTDYRDYRFFNQLCRAESLSTNSSSSLYIQLSFPQATHHYLEQESWSNHPRNTHSNTICRDKELGIYHESDHQPQQQQRQERYWSAVYNSDEIQHPAKLESLTIPEHLLDPHGAE